MLLAPCRPKFVSLILLMSLTLAWATSSAQAALVARYTFDNANISGTGMAGSPWVANDLQAPATNATASGTNGGSSILTGQPGVFGEAFRFTNDNTATTVADLENLLLANATTAPIGSAERTFSLWFNQQVAVGQNKLFGYGTNASGQALDVGLEAGGIRVRHFGGNLTYGSGFNFLPTGANGGWRHLAVRVNAGATTFANLNVFLDGVQLTSGGGAGEAIAIDTASSQLGIGTTSIVAGGAAVNGFTGLLDEFRVYDNALTNADILALSKPPALTLEVQTNTGRSFIKNTSGIDFTAGYYEISSADVANDGGSLVKANWNSLQDQNLAGFPAGYGTGNGWEEAGIADDKIFGEAFLGTTGAGSSLFADNMTPINLGSIFKTTETQDLSFVYQLANGSFVNGNVSYVLGTGVNGEYNGNGTVDAADYTVYRDNLGTSTTLPNDTTPGAVTAADYTVWKNNFGLSAGAGVAAGAAVPEPSTILLLAIVALAMISSDLALAARGSGRG